MIVKGKKSKGRVVTMKIGMKEMMMVRNVESEFGHKLEPSKISVSFVVFFLILLVGYSFLPTPELKSLQEFRGALSKFDPVYRNNMLKGYSLSLGVEKKVVDFKIGKLKIPRKDREYLLHSKNVTILATSGCFSFCEYNVWSISSSEDEVVKYSEIAKFDKDLKHLSLMFGLGAFIILMLLGFILKKFERKK